MNDKTPVLVVDDDADLRRLLSMRLKSADYDVTVAASAKEALSQMPVVRPAVVITDMKMDGMDGMALFEELRGRWPTVPVIILTAHGTIPDAIDATQRGVFAYLTKPFNGHDLLAQVEKAVVRSGGQSSTEPWRAAILTRSPKMEEVLRKARLVGASEVSVLLQGESGTGKELLANAVHLASPRSKAPFIAVNCAAVPEALLESELFGHVRGAFTGAVGERPGLFVAAHGGTLFLDEIGDMPMAFQAKLLRVLQERTVRPVGATRSTPVDVRVISATHADLETEAAAGRFREDLLYRLNVVTLSLPPLSERAEDIPLLARRFLETQASRHGRSLTFAPAAMAVLVGADWPGNVRQLHNVVEQCVALTPGAVVPEDLVASALRGRRPALATLDEVRSDAERDYLIRVLQLAQGNVSEAARLAGRNRTEFYRLLGRHGLDAAHYRT